MKKDKLYGIGTLNVDHLSLFPRFCILQSYGSAEDQTGVRGGHFAVKVYVTGKEFRRTLLIDFQTYAAAESQTGICGGNLAVTIHVTGNISELFDRLALLFTANGTGEGLFSGSRRCSFLGHRAIVPLVSGSLYELVGICVFTAGAGVGRKAVLGAGGRGNSRLVIVAELGAFIGGRFGRVAAFALRGLGTVLRAGGVTVGNIIYEAVAELFNGLGFFADQRFAYGAVDHAVLAAVGGAGGGYFTLCFSAT